MLAMIFREWCNGDPLADLGSVCAGYMEIFSWEPTTKDLAYARAAETDPYMKDGEEGHDEDMDDEDLAKALSLSLALPGDRSVDPS